MQELPISLFSIEGHPTINMFQKRFNISDRLIWSSSELHLNIRGLMQGLPASTTAILGESPSPYMLEETLLSKFPLSLLKPYFWFLFQLHSLIPRIKYYPLQLGFLPLPLGSSSIFWICFMSLHWVVVVFNQILTNHIFCQCSWLL